MKKKLLSTLLVLCMVLALLPMTAQAAETSGKCGDNVTWSYSDGTLTIQGTGSMHDWTGGMNDRSPWYLYILQIHTVIINDGVTTIGSRSFEHYRNLTSVTIPNSVTSIRDSAFLSCSSLTSISIPSSVTSIGDAAFYDCNSLTSVSIPSSVTSIGQSAFYGCSSLTSVAISDSVTYIGYQTFRDCSSLTNVIIPSSITRIGSYVFDGCSSLADVYYEGSENNWASMSIENFYNDPLLNATIHYNSKGLGQDSSEHIYDTTDPGEDTKLDADRLNKVTDPNTAASAVRDMTGGMTQAQKDSATGADLATLYAETAVAKAASKSFIDSDILINAVTIADLEAEAAQAVTAVDTALVNGGITTARYLSSTVTLTTSSTNEISIHIDPDILTSNVDKIRVEGPSYALTFNVPELKDDLTGTLTFKAEPVNASGTALAGGNTTVPLAATLLVNRTANTESVYLANIGTNAVKVTLPGGGTNNPVTVSLPKDNSKNTTYQTVVNATGTATSSKFNPATTNIDGKVNSSGTYTVATNEVNFTDITNKSVEMQKAIKYLASKGIISGTGGTNYSPDASISRAEIAALLVRALGKLNSSATNSFTDVKSSDWYYTAAGSSQKAGYISGFEDNTFRGTNPINKEQIVAVSARVLISDMKYKTPSNTASYLSKYSDTVASWAQPQVALATKENLVVYRTDGTFSGAKNMTRGDAAIIIYRLFQKIW